MGLAGYKAPTTEIPLGGGNFFLVKGLSLTDVAVLLREHFPDLDALAEIFQQAMSMSGDQMSQVVHALMSQAPGFVANVIALSAGEGSAKEAEQLPAPVQIKALLAIGNHTFDDVGGPGKALEMIADLLKKTDLVSPRLTKNKITT